MTLLKDKAIKAMLLGDWQTATSLNKSLLKDNPNDIDALNRLAYAFTILGKIKEAKTAYRKVLKLDMLNQIATRNLKRLGDFNLRRPSQNGNSSLKYVNHAFLEETGKTKIVSLVNVTSPKIIALLAVGQSIFISVKRSKIFIQDQNKQYIGVLPDDIGKRLIKLIKGGNLYEAYIKSANGNNVAIFIKETKRASRYKDYPSFLQGFDQDLTLSNGKSKFKNPKKYKDTDETKNYNLDEEDELS